MIQYLAVFRFLLTIFSSLLLIFCVSGCIKNVTNVGYTFKRESLNSIESGVSSQMQVFQLLGSPSARSSFGSDIWYYISTEYEHVAFFDPEIKKQTVFAIRFDEGGTVSDVAEYTEEDAKNVAFSKDSTPTEGHDLGVVEQLLGNVGRFNNGAGPSNIRRPGS